MIPASLFCTIHPISPLLQSQYFAVGGKPVRELISSSFAASSLSTGCRATRVEHGCTLHHDFSNTMRPFQNAACRAQALGWRVGKEAWAPSYRGSFAPRRPNR